jgi:hypothetical protein
MEPNEIPRLGKSAYFILPVVALALYIAFIPKLNYPYPVHIDEWVHIAHNNSLLQTGSLNYTDPFTGSGGYSIVASLESGFHVLFSVFYKISGMSWVDITRYLPGIIFAFTALSVYILARREGFGWEAAFFSCLLPTTVGIMGPAFFIPLALCLPFLPLSLFLIFNYRTLWSYLLLFIFLCFMIITHATSAICFILIMIPCVLLYLIKEPKHGLILLLMGVVPFLATLPWTFGLITSTFESLLVSQPLPANHDLPMILRTYGYIPFALGLLGTFWLAIKGGVKNYSMVLGLLVTVVMLAVFYTLHYGVALVYLRGILYTLLMFGIVAGASLNAIEKIELPQFLRLPQFARKIGYLFCLALVVVILVIAIPVRLNTPYYHMINEDDYQTFIWIKDNVGQDYQKAILDPWKATAFTAVTGKYVYARIHMGPDSITKSADEFLANGCTDTAFLRRNGISIIYTQQKCSNPDLTEVYQWIYLLKDL